MFNSSPLSIEEVQLIESSLLPNLEKHHLRLLAHCLFCFKEIARYSPKGSLPSHKKRLEWCMKQSEIKEDQDFILVLLKQFELAAKQLEQIANKSGISPLELNIESLIKYRQEELLMN